MKICSVTMTRTGSMTGAEDAINSVAPLVGDGVLLYEAGEITDFAKARNGALKMGVTYGYDWAIMLDADERIHAEGLSPKLPYLLERLDADVLMVPHVSGTYEKERIFRLPAKGHYRGRTHEAFIVDEGACRETLRGMTFDEIAKTPEHYRAKVERDLALLREQIQETPDDPRWWYYLGDTESGMGHPREASAAFQRCWELNGWDEESAWAAYRVAEILSGEGKFNEAIRWCTNGMLRHPGMSELPWLAGWCCYQLGRYQHAVWWEDMALALNARHAERQRIGFRYPPALAEAPYDVLRYAFHALGKHLLGDAMERPFTEALTARQQAEKIADPARED